MFYYLTLQDARKISNALACCQSSEETRYYLNGIAMQYDAKEGLQAIATDGHRLGRLKLTAISDDGINPITDALPEFSYILPKDAVTWLGKLPKKSTCASIVKFEQKESRITLTLLPDMTSATFNLVDGIFPEWRRVIPSEAPLTAGFSGKYLADIGKAVKAATDSYSAPLGLHITGPGAPAFITTNDAALSYVLMPMRM